MRRLGGGALVGAGLACLVAAAAWAVPPSQRPSQDAPRAERYAEGQVWEYRARPADKGSLLKIQKIEPWPGAPERGPIYHVTIIGVRVVTSTAAATMIQHAPVARQVLDASVTRLSDSRAVFPSADEGIREWREAKGGVFTITVAEIVDVVEQTMRNGT